jgi:hypothetical protein
MKTDREISQTSQSSLKEDERGAVMVEFLIAFLPIFFSFWCILQSAGVYSAKLVVMHSAYLGARAAGVVLADDPKNYGGAQQYSLSGKRKDDIEKAVMMGLIANGSLQTTTADIKVSGTGRRGMATVDVSVRYRCGLPVADKVVCGLGGSTTLKSTASFAIHGADYKYP